MAAVQSRGVQQPVFYLPDALLLIGARGLWGFLGGRPPSPALSPLASDDASRACANSILLTVRIESTNHGILQSSPPPSRTPSNLFPIGECRCCSTNFCPTHHMHSIDKPLTMFRCCKQHGMGILSTHKQLSAQCSAAIGSFLISRGFQCWNPSACCRCKISLLI